MNNKYEVLFEENKDEDLASIRLTTGKFSNTIYKYTYVSIQPPKDDPDGDAVLSFEYVIEKSPIIIDETNRTELEEVLFENLVDIIQDKQIYDEYRENNSHKSSL